MSLALPPQGCQKPLSWTAHRAHPQSMTLSDVLPRTPTTQPPAHLPAPGLHASRGRMLPRRGPWDRDLLRTWPTLGVLAWRQSCEGFTDGGTGAEFPLCCCCWLPVGAGFPSSTASHTSLNPDSNTQAVSGRQPITSWNKPSPLSPAREATLSHGSRESPQPANATLANTELSLPEIQSRWWGRH